MAVADGVIYFGTDFGELYALAGICGDVNCDGGVSMTDEQMVYNYLGGGSVCSKWSSDVNCDIGITMTDVQIIYASLGGGGLNCCL
jgi:hypothetical protein